MSNIMQESQIRVDGKRDDFPRSDHHTPQILQTEEIRTTPLSLWDTGEISASPNV